MVTFTSFFDQIIQPSFDQNLDILSKNVIQFRLGMAGMVGSFKRIFRLGVAGMVGSFNRIFLEKLGWAISSKLG